MNVILIFNNNEKTEVIEDIINSITFSYSKLIIKITDTESLDFYSYKKTFSPKNIELAQKLKLNKEIYFNFDIISIENLEKVKQSKLKNIFIDLYIEDNSLTNDYLAHKNNDIRIDLNIINHSKKDDNSSYLKFDNVDYYYYGKEDFINELMLKKDKGEFKDYILQDYKQSMIYQYSQGKWLLYSFGIERFIKTNILLESIQPDIDLKLIQKWILKKVLKSMNCSECNHKIDCVKNNTFFSFNEKEVCLLNKEN